MTRRPIGLRDCELLDAVVHSQVQLVSELPFLSESRDTKRTKRQERGVSPPWLFSGACIGACRASQRGELRKERVKRVYGFIEGTIWPRLGVCK